MRRGALVLVALTIGVLALPAQASSAVTLPADFAD
jgi:hypothetical protein